MASNARPRASDENGLLRPCGSIAVPNYKSVRGEKLAGSGKVAFSEANSCVALKSLERQRHNSSGSSPSKMGGGRKRQSSSQVKDVDGNDMGMGYFSAMLSCERSQPPPATAEIATVPTELAAANPRGANKEEGPKQGLKRSHRAPSQKAIASKSAKATRSANEAEKDADACIAPMRASPRGRCCAGRISGP